jgi:hypothetical protein
MLRELELGLADTLGGRLPAPLQGAVDAAPARPQARIVVTVRAAEAIDDELLSRRPERVPGAADPRRVLRLRCEPALEIRLPPGGSRADQMAAIDRTLYLLGDPALLDGRALLPEDPDADPGFLIQRLRLARVDAPGLVLLSAEGYFWPVGEAGVAGVAISALRLRQSLLPLRLQPEVPRLVAGGVPVPLTVLFGHAGTLQIDAGAGGPAAQPFGDVLFSLVDAGGRPGAGELAGGDAGAGGARRVAVADGQAAVQYTPPAAPATDFLLAHLADAAGAPVQRLGRLRLQVWSA